MLTTAARPGPHFRLHAWSVSDFTHAACLCLPQSGTARGRMARATATYPTTTSSSGTTASSTVALGTRTRRRLTAIPLPMTTSASSAGSARAPKPRQIPALPHHELCGTRRCLSASGERGYILSWLRRAAADFRVQFLSSNLWHAGDGRRSLLLLNRSVQPFTSPVFTALEPACHSPVSSDHAVVNMLPADSIHF